MIDLKNEIFNLLTKLKKSNECFNIFFVGCILDAIDDTLDLEGDEVRLFAELRKWVAETE